MGQGNRIGPVLGVGAVVLALVAMCSSPAGGQLSALGSGHGSAGPGVSVISSGTPGLPISGAFTVTSDFGARWGTLHGGIDLSSGGAAPILAALGGTVTFAGAAGNAGNMVQIDHGGGVVTKSMHLSRIDVSAGEAVWPGKALGIEGNTGDSQGAHLHFQVEKDGRSIDPRPFMATLGVTLPQQGSTGTGPAPATSQPPSSVRMADGAAGRARLKESAVPAAYLPWVVAAGATCQASPATLIAAQIEAESGWNPNATSTVGADGLSQFMPGTWAAYGRDDDGNGRVSPLDPGDAIMAQARYNCEISRLLASVPGDPTDLMLAGYNAGPGAVLAAGGIPPYAETRNYVVKIRSGMAKYSS